MRIKIVHETTYSYHDPVRSAVQLLRLTPRSNDHQFVHQWRVSVDADARLDKGEDAYGNVTHLVFIDGPLDALRILVEGEIETNDTGGFVRGGIERISEGAFLRQTELTAPSPEISDLARALLASEGGDMLACLHSLNATLHATMTFSIGATDATTDAGHAYAKRAGVCQDFAHIFIAAARSIGLPARYVSGYYLRSDMTEQEAGHAWAEAHIPGLGWIAFDPAQGLCATERHVRVAIGADGNEAAPIRGARSGGQSEALSVAISVAPGGPIASARPPMQSMQQQQ